MFFKFKGFILAVLYCFLYIHVFSSLCLLTYQRNDTYTLMYLFTLSQSSNATRKRPEFYWQFKL